MTKKGFFDSLFVLIILVLLTPRTQYINNQNIYYNYEEVNQRMIIVDSVVADALSDSTFADCSIRPANIYAASIEAYLDAMDNYWSNNTAIDCDYKLNNETVASNVFSADIDISCTSKNKYNFVDTKKKTTVKKEIYASRVNDYCKVKITDDPSNFVQVDLNQSMT
jgi:hypothetical protein